MRLFAGVFAFILAVTVPAKADVTFCNKTSAHNLSFAVAAEVTQPYATWEVAGWFNIDAGTCKTTFTGDYTGQKVYWFAYANGDRDLTWESVTDSDYYTLCVPSDTSEFDRKGSASDLQPPCKNSWKSQKFYCVAIGAKDFTFSLYLASDPNAPEVVRKPRTGTGASGGCG